LELDPEPDPESDPDPFVRDTDPGIRIRPNTVFSGRYTLQNTAKAGLFETVFVPVVHDGTTVVGSPHQVTVLTFLILKNHIVQVNKCRIIHIVHLENLSPNL
jgi:hypothetical protein